MPRGIDIPGVEDMPQGDKTSRVTPKGDRVSEEDVRGRGGDGNPPPPNKPRSAETAAEKSR